MPKKYRKQPEWLASAQHNALEYLYRFVNNPGVERIANAFDARYSGIRKPDDRIAYLAEIAATHWDYRKGRERFEVTETYDLDNPDSELGKLVLENASYAEMVSGSTATLRHYSIMAILGGANQSPYNRLRYGLDQDVSYDMLAYLGSERKLLEPEQENVKNYAAGAQTEFDLGIGAINTLMRNKLIPGGGFDVATSEWHIARVLQKSGIPIYSLSAPALLGNGRANTADTYDFLRRLEQEAMSPTKNILFVTAAQFRYAQYFDAVREISLRTGVDIETIGFDPSYARGSIKPTQFLQELKSAADSAVKLRRAVGGDEERNEWRIHYYNRFTRNEDIRP